MKSFEIELLVPQDLSHTWEYFFNQINGWWPSSYHSSERTKQFLIQTFIGGKVYEDFGEGDGLIWGDVIGVDYLSSLEIKGNLTKSFGGPAITYDKFSFIETTGGTNLRLSVYFIGDVDDKTVKSLKTGWEELIGSHFRQYCQDRI